MCLKLTPSQSKYWACDFPYALFQESYQNTPQASEECFDNFDWRQKNSISQGTTAANNRCQKTGVCAQDYMFMAVCSKSKLNIYSSCFTLKADKLMDQRSLGVNNRSTIKTTPQNNSKGLISVWAKIIHSFESYFYLSVECESGKWLDDTSSVETLLHVQKHLSTVTTLPQSVSTWQIFYSSFQWQLPLLSVCNRNTVT